MELEFDINAIEEDATLHEQKNFNNRADAIDFIEFQVMGELSELVQQMQQPNRWTLLKCRTEKIKAELEGVDFRLFQKLRANIQAKADNVKRFKDIVGEYFNIDIAYKGCLEDPGYDNLDVFINGILSFQAMPDATKELEPEMVYYQKTPARVVFELVEKCHFSKEDVFVDVGSGLGQVTILVNLLTGVTAKGVELEPAFCAYANDCAKQLNLPNVTFINADARYTDYSEGTIFFMFTPFKGKILKDVLEILRKESLLRKITIITYGPCTTEIALQSWLHFMKPEDDNVYAPRVFSSGKHFPGIQSQ